MRITAGSAGIKNNIVANRQPIIFYNLFQSIETLTRAVATFIDNCLSGITANVEICRELVDNSVGIITALVPSIGYGKAEVIAKEAIATRTPVKEIILRELILTEEELAKILDPYRMTEPGEY